MSGPVVKICRCSASYTAHTWKLLPKIGRQRDWVIDLELRHCTSCETTLAIARRRRGEGPTLAVLRKRAAYGGRKGRSALRRLRERRAP